MSILRRLFELGVTPNMTVIDAKHVRFTNILAVLVACMMLPWVPVNLYAGQWFTSVEVLVVGLVPLAALALNSRGRHRDAVIVLLLVGSTQMAFSAWVFGAHSGAPLYYILVMFTPYLLFRKQNQGAAHLFAALAVVAFVTLTVYADQLPPQVEIMDIGLLYAINTGVVATVLLVMAAVFRNLVTDTENALEAERARADKLLLNVLPPPVAERLKRSPDTAIADRHDQITVLFADIVGFTPLSARLSAGRTVELLNQIFTAFDAMCDRIGVEKIRTIGDGYMAVAGAPIARPDHAEAMVRVAIAMRDHMASNPVDEPLQVRIGLNSGEAVAGIVGTTRFHYDLWGDAVNVAARMESLGEPGKIHIAKGTYDLIEDKYPCESRGAIPVKGKGEMETWFVC